LRRAKDPAKDQSYVLYMLGQDQLSRVRLPVGHLTKDEVRRVAAELGLRTAGKPDSQDVCFIPREGGRQAFLGQRIDLRPGQVLDGSGAAIGSVPAVELVTIGQRRGLGSLRPPAPGPAGGPDTPVAVVSDRGPAGPGLPGLTVPDPEAAGLRRVDPRPAGSRPPSGDDRRYVVDIDLAGAAVTVGPLDALLVQEVALRDTVWVDQPPADDAELELQVSAHGRPARARWSGDDVVQVLDAPIRRVAPGQSVVLYRGDSVIGGGLAV
jgi:tRNA-specific 2-thiouridylase